LYHSKESIERVLVEQVLVGRGTLDACPMTSFMPSSGFGDVEVAVRNTHAH
jgi:hypothetical protein